MHFIEDTTNQFYYRGAVDPREVNAKHLLQEYTPNRIAVDVETISLKERIAVGVGISFSPDLSFYFPLFPEESPNVPWHLLRNPNITKIYQNGIFDLVALREYDTDITNIVDTNVAARLLCYKETSLSSATMLNVHNLPAYDMGQVLKEHNAKTTLQMPREAVALKCMQDTAATYKLWDELKDRVDMQYLLSEMEIIPICLEMSYRGVLIDQEERQRIEDELQLQADQLFAILKNEGFIKVSSQQVAYILMSRGAYRVFPKIPFTKPGGRGQPVTDRATLEKMDDPLASVILLYRRYVKILSTYIKPWSHDDRAYTLFHLDAATGRPSSTSGGNTALYRNLQNVPGKKLQAESGVPNCRGCLLPDTGVFTDVDWSQLELRIMAYISQDYEMMRVFQEGGDVHQTTADFLGIPRGIAKNVNFALVYGATDQTLAETAHIRDVRRAGRLREEIFRLYRGIGAFVEEQHYLARHGATSVRTLGGRYLRIPGEDEDSPDGRERKMINYQVQGSAAEILKKGLRICKDMPLALQVHDELLCDGYIPDGRFEPLRHVAPFETPIEVKYLMRWE